MAALALLVVTTTEATPSFLDAVQQHRNEALLEERWEAAVAARVEFLGHPSESGSLAANPGQAKVWLKEIGGIDPMLIPDPEVVVESLKLPVDEQKQEHQKL